MYYKITKGPTSQRGFCLGYSDRDLPINIDREDVAKIFESRGWPYEEVDIAEGEVIKCLDVPLLRRAISLQEQMKAGKKQGKWKIHLPEGGLPKYRYGFNTHEEIITEDFDNMKKFVADGCRAEVIQEEEEPEVEAASDAKVEGEDVQKRGPGRPRKGGPMTTYDLPKSAREE